jgi:hypothetical protein
MAATFGMQNRQPCRAGWIEAPRRDDRQFAVSRLSQIFAVDVEQLSDRGDGLLGVGPAVFSDACEPKRERSSELKASAREPGSCDRGALALTESLGGDYASHDPSAQC